MNFENNTFSINNGFNVVIQTHCGYLFGWGYGNGDEEYSSGNRYGNGYGFGYRYGDGYDYGGFYGDGNGKGY